MEKNGDISESLSLQFFPAGCCIAETLAAVYSEDDQELQLLRLQAVLIGKAADHNFFCLASRKGQPLTMLHLSRDQHKPYRFRTRGLYTQEQFRGRGLATSLLKFGAESIFSHQQGEEIVSFIRPDHYASIAAHKHAGFLPADVYPLQSQYYSCFMLNKAWTSQAGTPKEQIP